MLADSELFGLLKTSAADCARLAAAVTESAESQAPIAALKHAATDAGLAFEEDQFERALLRYAATETESGIADLPVHVSVKKLLRDEFRFYSAPARGASIELGSFLFVTGCKIISLRRFPAGPMDWEMSGFSRSWLLQVDKMQLPRVAWFLAMRTGGFRPMFFMHVARSPKRRALLIEKEVLRSYYRMARSLELQASIKGILASAWFHDPAAVSDNPHLAALSRPYLEGGGMIVLGHRAPADSGFLDHNAGRKDQFESGSLAYRLGLALWPRDAAIDWARRHPELDG